MKKRHIVFKEDNISDDEKREVKQLFDLINEDGDKSISADEFYDCLRYCGLDVDRQCVQAFVEEADQDNSGEIDLDEFTTMLCSPVMR